MKVVLHFKGGLGNQLIQYAFVQKFLSDTGTEPIFDTSHFSFIGERKFHLGNFPQSKVPKWNILVVLFKMYFRIVFKKLYKMGLLPYSKSVLDNYIDDDFDLNKLNQVRSKYLFVNGYFQHLEIFPLPKSNLLHRYLDNLSHRLANNETFRLIKRSPNPIMLHLRRGDYVSNEAVRKGMGSCGITYFRNGIELLSMEFKEFSLFVFSDDIEYAAELFKEFDNIHFVKGDTSDPIHDFLLMRCFKYAVISNSTLSYMASMLSSFEDNVIVTPDPWFEDEKKFLLGMKKSWKHVDKA